MRMMNVWMNEWMNEWMNDSMTLNSEWLCLNDCKNYNDGWQTKDWFKIHYVTRLLLPLRNYPQNRLQRTLPSPTSERLPHASSQGRLFDSSHGRFCKVSLTVRTGFKANGQDYLQLHACNLQLCNCKQWTVNSKSSPVNSELHWTQAVALRVKSNQ